MDMNSVSEESDSLRWTEHIKSHNKIRLSYTSALHNLYSIIRDTSSGTSEDRAKRKQCRKTLKVLLSACIDFLQHVAHEPNYTKIRNLMVTIIINTYRSAVNLPRVIVVDDEKMSDRHKKSGTHSDPGSSKKSLSSCNDSAKAFEEQFDRTLMTKIQKYFDNGSSLLLSEQCVSNDSKLLQMGKSGKHAEAHSKRHPRGSPVEELYGRSSFESYMRAAVLEEHFYKYMAAKEAEVKQLLVNPSLPSKSSLSGLDTEDTTTQRGTPSCKTVTDYRMEKARQCISSAESLLMVSCNLYQSSEYTQENCNCGRNSCLKCAIQYLTHLKALPKLNAKKH